MGQRGLRHHWNWIDLYCATNCSV